MEDISGKPTRSEPSQCPWGCGPVRKTRIERKGDRPSAPILKVVFHPLMVEPYDNTPAGAPGRLNSSIEILRSKRGYRFLQPAPASEAEICLAHDPMQIERVRRLSSSSRTDRLLQMAMLAAGGATLAAEIAVKGEPAFGLIRPPGHHASGNISWGFCYFNNMAIALLNLRSKGLIRSAFVLDFDLHVGDGTLNILSAEKDFTIYNPSGHGDDEYLANVERALEKSPEVDIITASAGFDQYIEDWGRNLSTQAYKKLGYLMYDFAEERCEGRRFGLLEGGYNFEDLGINIHAFCEGLRGLE